LNLHFQEGWCDSKGTLQDVKTKIQMRQEGAFKRERAIAYSLAQKVLKLNLFEFYWLSPPNEQDNSNFHCFFSNGDQPPIRIPLQMT
jgi:hypothetical protein